jgi:hypothetical protein
MYLYNLNKPSELTLDNTGTFLTNGDEFIMIITYDDTELTYNIPNSENEKSFI